MTWSLENSKNDEASKIRWETVPYFHGRVLDIGCGPYKCFPHWIGVDNGHHWGPAGRSTFVQCDAKKLDLFMSQSCDAVFSSHLLEHFEYEDAPAVLSEWVRVIKPNGHLMLYLPDEDQYPKVGEPYANPDHKWNVNFERVLDAMRTLKRGWDLIEYEVRSAEDEYSLWFVFRMIQGREQKESWRLPKPSPRCAVIRYGAIGDMVQMSSILPALKRQGYWIDLYCQAGPGYDVIRTDPHVDRFIVQGKDEVPPQFLQEFWDYTRKKYDKWVNLCESVEGTLLANPGRTNWEWPNACRAKYLDRNYLEWTHELAEVPFEPRSKFYSTLEEKAWARKKAAQWGRKNILWSLSGSSGHKMWPHIDIIIARVMLAWTDVHIVTVGDDFCRILEVPWEKEPRVHCKSGAWSIRKTLAFAEAADLVIGTETGVLNAAGLMEVPKIIMLSHSSEHMLTKHWKHTVALRQPQGVGCPKQPCRQLHGGGGANPWDDCPQHEETGASLCQYHIDPEEVWGAVLAVIGMPERMAA